MCFIVGSTDAVACSTNGTEDPMTATLHIILGRSCLSGSGHPGYQTLWSGHSSQYTNLAGPGQYCFVGPVIVYSKPLVTREIMTKCIGIEKTIIGVYVI